MKNPIFRSDFDVDLVAHMGSDELICKAARVSTLGAASLDTVESHGLLKFLMGNRHGSPFEHGTMLFRITTLVSVWREFMRHRIGFSYNEQSGRYMELDGVFYIPPPERPLVQVGKPGAYEIVPGNRMQYELMERSMRFGYTAVWDMYQSMLEAGIAKEVSRFPLSVGIYSTAYVTCNPRSLMSFLSLRTQHEETLFPSFPMWEINQVANQMEAIFAELFPTTHEVFNQCRRVSP